MKSYLKKCLIIYISLAVILVGMAGVSYAITAGQADSYITRAKYVVDMEYLQNKLDETEVTLMGRINKYRSTNVKFVTYDTPKKYNTSTAGAYNGGIHTGGNYFPKTRYNNGSYTYAAGLHYTGTNYKNGGYRTLYINRVWNGDYYVTTPLYMSDEAATPNIYYGCVNFAVPIENLKGWYLVLKSYMHDNSMWYRGAIVKLDPTVTYAEETSIPSKDLLLRFKKNLFTYSSTQTTKFTKEKVTKADNHNRYANQSYLYGLNRIVWSGLPYTVVSMTTQGWIDEVTGDYMVVLRGFTPCGPTNGFVEYQMNDFVSRLMPADNVEYVQHATSVYESGYTGFPDARHIGDGLSNDPYWTYEFVDCINGIKYWHAHRKATKIQYGSGEPFAYGVHYSLPIVY